jgi:hypothetical protein
VAERHCNASHSHRAGEAYNLLTTPTRLKCSLSVLGTLAEGGRFTAPYDSNRLAHRHAIRWRVSHRTVGYGHLYQGRFKSFRVQSDEHLLGLLRYVERNPLSAGLVDRAQLWRWGSLWSTTRGTEAIKALLSPWPVERPAKWTGRVNAPLTKKELDRVRVSIERGRLYGEER